MHLPKLKQIPRTRSSVNAFKGYNHAVDCAENEWYEAQNLSARNYPALSPRLPRKLVSCVEKPNGMYAKNGLLWVDGTALYYNASKVGTVADSVKQFCGIGTKVLIWPDKLMFDTATLTLAPLGATWQSTGNVTVQISKEDGSSYAISATGSTAPETPENGDYWLDTSGERDVLRVYAAATETWGAVETTFLKIASTGIGAAFAQYDTVTVGGLSSTLFGDAAATLNTALVVWDKGEDYLVVTGLLDSTVVQGVADGIVTVSREIPDLDFITQNDNRIWGCNSADNTLHACKLGDPTNWNSYMGTAADSYVVTVGSDGAFTGATTALGYVLFFKENLMHKIYGTKPSNYQVTTLACRGVQPGSAASLVTVNETLYYKATDGIMQYDGGLPVEVGQALGDARQYAAVAGATAGCYYVSMQDGAGQHSLYVLDVSNGLWQREDDLQIVSLVAANQCLYALTRIGNIFAMGNTDEVGGMEEVPVTWMAQTGVIGRYTPDAKTVSRLEVRFFATQGASVTIEAQYDHTGVWQQLAQFTARQDQIVLLPIIPHRFTQMQLRLSGKGDVTLYQISKLLEQGSERRWQT